MRLPRRREISCHTVTFASEQPVDRRIRVRLIPARAAGIALLVAASGKIDIKTTVLLTPEEVDAAVKVTGDYRPPGG